jgi:hypothetical protein
VEKAKTKAANIMAQTSDVLALRAAHGGVGWRLNAHGGGSETLKRSGEKKENIGNSSDIDSFLQGIIINSLVNMIISVEYRTVFL